MSKYSKDKKEPMILKHVYFEVESIKLVDGIHDNFSEFVRDAVDIHVRQCAASSGISFEGVGGLGEAL